MYVVGLTGGIGSGKSTVADLLARHGVYLIDADVVAREVVGPKTPGLEAIIERFGRELLTSNGTLDRRRLAEIAFSNPDQLAALNAIVHPLVRERIDHILNARRGTDDVVVLSVPLMVESRRYDYDVLIVVDLPEDLAVDRALAERGWSLDEARARVSAQTDRQTRLAAADFVIDNSGTLEALSDSVEDVWRSISARFQSC